MRGKKGLVHPRTDDPPRRRANKKKGHGTWASDRPPIAGLVGRHSKQMRLKVLTRSSMAQLQAMVLGQTQKGSVVNTDEWVGYARLREQEREHRSVDHNPRCPEFARDDDGDGIREVHCNTMEGIWTGLRNFLRTFRGVSKKYLFGYVAIFEWAHNLKVATCQFLRALLGVDASTE